MRVRDVGKTPGADKPQRPASRTVSTAPSPAVHARGGPAPDTIPALQRSVGNAAVTRMVQRDAHRHDAGSCQGEHADTVQRSAVHDVLRSRGRSLPEPVVSEMEGRLGAPAGTFRAVSLHDSPRDIEVARSIGAIAFTSGDHVVGDVSRPQVLAHELHHVRQQRQGPVPGTDTGNGLRISDRNDRAEREAEAVSAAAMAAPAPVQRDTVQRDTDRTFATTRSGPAAGGAVEIQRKVGFEFETNMLVRAGEEPVISKNEKVFEAASGDWYITPDASALEFVTVPFEEEGDTPELERMGRAVSEMANAFGQLHTATKLAALMDGNAELHEVLSEEGTTHQHNGNDVYVPGTDRLYPPLAKPQATGGVALERMLALFEAVVSQELPLKSPSNPEDVAILGEDPEKRTNTTTLGGANPRRDAAILTDARSLADKYVTDLQTSETGELKGLLALVFSYLLAGAQQSGRQDQAKYFLPLMSRMSFSAMYAALPEEARSAFDPARVLAVAGLVPDDPVYKEGFADHGAGDTAKSRGPRRRQWLDSIASGGPDLMSAGGGSAVTEGMKASSPAMGQHHRLDPGHAPDVSELVQIELRRLPGQVPPEEWLPVAAAIFEMFRQVQGTRA
ncbi:DUF4157 domain-containing protein [Streptomyces sp. FIT100]|uniref:eCIS core domain-containing protein n=1 Tax=Streptomyces sp. FIT100 TaxID=2837956 RepID=UPI0021C619F6|nr:DUF4157 domain-containing protein [Streptomyces sp. FIT100]UUN26496.1 DUF4157 domain-containing protein [Streptomyces sp. FIT100]